MDYLWEGKGPLCKGNPDEIPDQCPANAEDGLMQDSYRRLAPEAFRERFGADCDFGGSKWLCLYKYLWLGGLTGKNCALVEVPCWKGWTRHAVAATAAEAQWSYGKVFGFDCKTGFKTLCVREELPYPRRL
jgi:hypothetical protein